MESSLRVLAARKPVELSIVAPVYKCGECVPEMYIPQMLWQMACCPGYQWCDFVSYCADFPEPLDLFICRLPRDDQRIAAMEAEAVKFLSGVETMVLRLKRGLEGALSRSLASVSSPGDGTLHILKAEGK